ncbi:MAG: SET domain-containing protein-lysine N-methyltransferase [Gemmatimonadaceae bacterium]|nr:SET domain-containing protein-lysine N-methyltransferase [Gemmatimonadaceae bacterium]
MKSPKLVKPPKSELYEVRRSKIQGRGAFAVKPIRKGQIVDEYWGQRITHEEADRRYDDNEGRHHTFLFVLDDDTVLDARFGGNDARFINHSCDPNCETEIENGHIYIKAIKAIKPESELVYDYRFEWQDEYEPEDIRYYACRCGSPKCRGTILRVPVYLRPTVREWLAGNDVKKPRKPVRKRAAKAADAKEKHVAHPHVAERHAKTKKNTKKSVKKSVKKGVKSKKRSVKR